MHVTRKGAGAFGGFLFFLLASTTASATLVNFNSLADGADNTAIKNYLNSAGVLGAGSVLSVSGAVASKCYDGDNHSVGPTGSGLNNPCGESNSRRSLTLGTTDGYVKGTSANPNSSSDTFLMNIGGTSAPNDRITIVFAGALTSISFDLEIFPDASCTSKTNCGTNQANWPDFKLNVNGTLINTWIGVDPSASGAPLLYTNSPAMTGETAPQLLTVSGVWNLGSIGTGPTTVEFIDWPQRIGIDNLNVVCCKRPPNETPEPGTLALIGVALAGLAGISRRRRNS